MRNSLLYSLGIRPSCGYAVRQLSNADVLITDHPSPDVTHLLLDVPSFSCETCLSSVLPSLPDSITIIGGKLPSSIRRPVIDLLEDPFYLAENAAITAECALGVAFQKLSCTFYNSEILIIGWGRIGKHLSRLLSALGAKVSVCSRSADNQAEIASLGMSPLAPESSLMQYRVIFNTAPAVVIPQELPAATLKIDLASRPGLLGDDVIRANGLPGRYAPEASGNLIARTILRKLKEEAK